MRSRLAPYAANRHQFRSICESFRTARTLMKPIRLTAILLLLSAIALFPGCSSVSTREVIDLTPFKHIYVVHRLTDDHHIDDLLVHELQALGHDASSGPLTMLPENADAVLTYEDRWEWDFKSYMIELDLELRTARTDKKLADGRYYQPTPNSKPPAEVVHDLLVPLFKKK